MAQPYKKEMTRSKYVPPPMCEGADKKGETMFSAKKGDKLSTVNVKKLSENITHQDLMVLFKPFGEIRRIYLAKDKITHSPKGFAFIKYRWREDAEKAISHLDGYNYDQRFLSVKWAKMLQLRRNP